MVHAGYYHRTESFFPEPTMMNFFCCTFFWDRSVVVDLGGCSLKYFALGDSMAPGKQVCSFVINCLCRKFFMDERPTISRKHYFFSSVSVSSQCNVFVLFFKNIFICCIYDLIFRILCFLFAIQEVFMSDSSDYSYVERCFSGAASVLNLPLCDEVYFTF